jgi:hypothetical protein
MVLLKRVLGLLESHPLPFPGTPASPRLPDRSAPTGKACPPMATKRITPKDPTPQPATPAEQAGAEAVKRETLAKSDRDAKENLLPVEW